MIIVENALRVATINSLGDFMLFISKLLVTLLTLLVAVLFVKEPNTEYLDFVQYKYHSLTFIVVGTIAFLIAHCFFTVYEVDILEGNEFFSIFVNDNKFY